MLRAPHVSLRIYGHSPFASGHRGRRGRGGGGSGGGGGSHGGGVPRGPGGGASQYCTWQYRYTYSSCSIHSVLFLAWSGWWCHGHRRRDATVTVPMCFKLDSEARSAGQNDGHPGVCCVDFGCRTPADHDGACAAYDSKSAVVDGSRRSVASRVFKLQAECTVSQHNVVAPRRCS